METKAERNNRVILIYTIVKKQKSHKNITTDTHIISIKPVAMNSQKPLTGKGRNIVTGLFVQHAVNVRKYTFKEVTTGKTGTINATANHPLYVKNRSAFIPIEKVTGSDNLITETGQSVKLICQENRKDHCGVAYGDGQPLPVYNLQIANRHTYFVGKDYKILVHNCTKKRKLPMQAKRKIGDSPPNPKLIPYQNGGNCTSIALCAALQEARHWYDVPDDIIKQSYRSYALTGTSRSLIESTLNSAGIERRGYEALSGATLTDELHRTDAELAIVSADNHSYMVIKSDHSPTGYLQLNQPYALFNWNMKYKVLLDDENYKFLNIIRPKKARH